MTINHESNQLTLPLLEAKEYLNQYFTSLGYGDCEHELWCISTSLDKGGYVKLKEGKQEYIFDQYSIIDCEEKG